MRRRAVLSGMATLSAGAVTGCVDLDVSSGPQLAQNALTNVSREETTDSMALQAQLELGHNRYETESLELLERSVISYEADIDGEMEVFVMTLDALGQFRTGEEFSHFEAGYDRGSTLAAELERGPGEYVVVLDNSGVGSVEPDGPVEGQVSISYQPSG